jgi:orotate phosphoribosyltransferase
MTDLQNRFLKLALEHEVLRFGEFTLKSGRSSPYFFNAGLFNTGSSLASLGRCYAEAIVNSGVEFDVLFGPAYKGIPLASVTAAALYEHHNIDTPYAFNRKEIKAHGEGGQIVGATLKGRILVIDDVITAGTAIREAADIILANGAEMADIIIALDRQERGQGKLSAVQEVTNEFSVPVISIASVTDLMILLSKQGKQEILKTMQNHQSQFGIAQ